MTGAVDMGGYAGAGEEGGPSPVGMSDSEWSATQASGTTAGGSLDTSVTTATAPVGSQEWWGQAIAEHSAGLESYTPPSAAGEPGVTQLTEAGLMALGITYSEPTYSWFETTATPVPVPLPPGTITFLGIDFTPLANLIRTPILEGLTEITEYLKGIVKGVTDTLSTVFKPAFLAIGGLITDILTGISTVATDAGKYVVGIYDQVFKGIAATLEDVRMKLVGFVSTVSGYIKDAVHDLEVWMQGVWAGAIKDVSEILAAVRTFGPDLQKALDRLPDTAMIALLRALDQAVSTW